MLVARNLNRKKRRKLHSPIQNKITTRRYFRLCLDHYTTQVIPWSLANGRRQKTAQATLTMPRSSEYDHNHGLIQIVS